MLATACWLLLEFIYKIFLKIKLSSSYEFLICRWNFLIKPFFNLFVCLFIFKRNAGTSKKQSSSGRKKDTELQIIEKDIIDHFTALFLLCYPKDYIFSYFILLPYKIHRNIFWIPKSFHNATYLSPYRFALNDESTKSLNGYGTADDRPSKKFFR